MVDMASLQQLSVPTLHLLVVLLKMFVVVTASVAGSPGKAETIVAAETKTTASLENMMI